MQGRPSKIGDMMDQWSDLKKDYYQFSVGYPETLRWLFYALISSYGLSWQNKQTKRKITATIIAEGLTSLAAQKDFKRQYPQYRYQCSQVNWKNFKAELEQVWLYALSVSLLNSKTNSNDDLAIERFFKNWCDHQFLPTTINFWLVTNNLPQYQQKISHYYPTKAPASVLLDLRLKAILEKTSYNIQNLLGGIIGFLPLIPLWWFRKDYAWPVLGCAMLLMSGLLSFAMYVFNSRYYIPRVVYLALNDSMEWVPAPTPIKTSKKKPMAEEGVHQAVSVQKKAERTAQVWRWPMQEAPTPVEPKAPSKAWLKHSNKSNEGGAGAAAGSYDEETPVKMTGFTIDLKSSVKTLPMRLTFNPNDTDKRSFVIYAIPEKTNTYYVFLIDDIEEDLHNFIQTKELTLEGGKHVVRPVGAQGDKRIYCSKERFDLNGQACTLYIGEKFGKHTGHGSIPTVFFQPIVYTLQVSLTTPMEELGARP